MSDSTPSTTPEMPLKGDIIKVTRTMKVTATGATAFSAKSLHTDQIVRIAPSDFDTQIEVIERPVRESSGHIDRSITEKRRKWVKVLREGNLPQAKGALHRIPMGESPGQMGYCCLGVACLLVPDLTATISMGKVLYGSEAASGGMPQEVFNALGLTVSDPAIGFPDDLTVRTVGEPSRLWPAKGTTLSALNDDWGLSLKQIGDVIDYFGFAEEHDVLQGDPGDPEWWGDKIRHNRAKNPYPAARKKQGGSIGALVV